MFDFHLAVGFPSHGQQNGEGLPLWQHPPVFLFSSFAGRNIVYRYLLSPFRRSFLVFLNSLAETTPLLFFHTYA